MKLLDTSILVEIDRGNNPGKIERLESEGTHCISKVSVTEMYLGLEKLYEPGTQKYSRKRSELEKLLSRFELLGMDRKVLVRAAKIISQLREKGKPVNDLHDVYIAASALTEDLELLTKNQRHFNSIEGIRIREWSNY